MSFGESLKFRVLLLPDAEAVEWEGELLVDMLFLASFISEVVVSYIKGFGFSGLWACFGM